MAATETDYTGLVPNGEGVYLGDNDSGVTGQWGRIARAVQALNAVYKGKQTTGTEPTDVLHGLAFGADGQTTNHLDWRIFVNSSGDLLYDENTGTDASPVWTTRSTLSAGGGGTLANHATQHKHGGGDEVATATAGANLIPKAGAGGTLADGWIAQSNVTQHEAAINHDALTGFFENDHVDHSTVSITAGTGLSGGGDLTSTRTLDFNIITLATNTPVTGDSFVYHDLDQGGPRRSTISTLNGVLVHDDLFGAEPNEHLDWTSASVGTISDTNLSANVVKYNTAGEFTAPQGATEETPSFAAGTLTLDFSTTNYWELTLSANVTTVTVSNATQPGTYVLKLTQDSTPRTIAWGSSVKWPGGTAPVMSTGSGAVDIISFVVDSAGNVYGSFAQDLS